MRLGAGAASSPEFPSRKCWSSPGRPRGKRNQSRAWPVQAIDRTGSFRLFPIADARIRNGYFLRRFLVSESILNPTEPPRERARDRRVPILIGAVIALVAATAYQ